MESGGKIWNGRGIIERKSTGNRLEVVEIRGKRKREC